MAKLMYFRSDLRIDDNPALHAACASAQRAGTGVVAVYTICPAQWRDEHDWADIKVEFILRQLRELRGSLRDLNVPLKILSTPRFDGVPDALSELAGSTGCDAVFFNDEYGVNEQSRDERIVDRFERDGRASFRFTDQVVFKPGSLRTNSGDVYKVYSPFKRAWWSRFGEEGLTLTPRPKAATPIGVTGDSIPDSVEGFSWSKERARGWAERWPVGESHALGRLGAFLQHRVDGYPIERDRPDLEGTSTLSPYLAQGIISPRRCVLAAAEQNDGRVADGRAGVVKWIEELIWREFYRHILVGFPRVSRHRAFRVEYDAIRWHDNDGHLRAWAEGMTGYPIVDAAMRQLAETGWMHNRLRMIAAMFLTKDLFLDWRLGERHFMRTLIDGDLASNNGGWQWSASTGTDAQPYFRVFNPTSQSEKCDPDGEFIRRYVPELREVGGKAIHDPSRLSEAARRRLGYPDPIVDHATARVHAIDAFKALRA